VADRSKNDAFQTQAKRRVTSESGIDAFSLYKKYYIDRDYEQVELFRLLKESFGIRWVIYPGSYIQISPSFIFPEVVYIDSDKKAVKCFQSGQLLEIIHDRKEYPEDPIVTFHGADFRAMIPNYRKKFDLLISQYAGFISEACKPYLKLGGHLLVNNSHGDAGLASIDPDFQLIATVHKRSGKYRISNSVLNEYFIPKKGIRVTKELLYERKRGVGYTKTAALYLFQRIS